VTNSSTDWELPESLQAIFAENSDLDAVFAALMPALCEAWRCDRCFLYLRNPQTGQGRITHCWGTSPEWADLSGSDWLEEGDIASKDPLMAIAFRTAEPVFVEDIETAGPEIINLDYERDVFQHRALIHAPLYHEGLMYGILEPCVFKQPRVWTEGDRRITTEIQAKLSPLAAAYLHKQGNIRVDG
jgi:GAF domain-containing protein